MAGSVQIKDDGQWIRWFNKQPQGMRSPVTQARMQAMLLKELLTRTVKQKGFFDDIELDVLIAISDSGTIQWPSSGALREVCKADQVPDRILEKLGSSRAVWRVELLSAQHRQVIGDFLRAAHQPLAHDKVSAVPAESVDRHIETAVGSSASLPSADTPAALRTVLPEKICKHCSGTILDAQYGKFGYYFACKACAKNTGIKFSCPQCGEEGRVRKQGKSFFAECRECDASVLYHTND